MVAAFRVFSLSLSVGYIYCVCSPVELLQLCDYCYTYDALFLFPFVSCLQCVHCQRECVVLALSCACVCRIVCVLVRPRPSWGFSGLALMCHVRVRRCSILCTFSFLRVCLIVCVIGKPPDAPHPSMSGLLKRDVYLSPDQNVFLKAPANSGKSRIRRAAARQLCRARDS